MLARAESRDRIAPDGPAATDRLTGRDAGMGDAEAAVGRSGPGAGQLGGQLGAGQPGAAGRAAADPGAAFAELMAGLDTDRDRVTGLFTSLDSVSALLDALLHATSP